MSAPLSDARQLAPTRARHIDLDGAEGRPVAALVAGPTGPARGAVVLVPGYTGTKEDFAPLLDPIADAGFDVVAIDLPGQYQSPGPDDPAGFLPAALAADLVVVAGALRSAGSELPLHLVGHSYGGLVARAAVLAAPAAFDSLVLLDSGPAAIDGGRRALVDAMEPVLAAHGVAGVYEATMQLARRDPRWVAPPPALGEFLRTRFLASSAPGLEGMGAGIRTEPDRVEELAALTVRCLVVCGEADDAWPVAVQQAMAARLGAGFAVIPGAAHSPAVENPTALFDVLVPFWAASG